MTRFRASLSPVSLLALALLVGLLPGTVHGHEATPASANGTGKVLRIYEGGFRDTLDPQFSDSSFSVAGLNYEGLTRIDETIATVPAAAASWEFSEDGLTLTFHLRDGLTYSDGSPLTAEHFAYAVERSCDPRTEAPYASFIFAITGCEAWSTSLDAAAGTPLATPGIQRDATAEAARASLGVRAVDDRTLELTLDEPAPYMPTLASTWLFYPVPRAVVTPDPEGWWKNPANLIGNGPFQVSQIDGELPDQRIRFVANEHYWGGRAKLDGIDYVYFEDAAEALEAYKRDELDIGFAPYPYGGQPEIANDPELSQELLVVPLAATLHFGFDNAQEPFTDKKVREAFAYGFDREGFCRDVWSGACFPTSSWIPPRMPGHIETDAYAYDPEAAKQALADSSYGSAENLPEVTYRYYVGEGDEESRDLAEWVAENYRTSLGIELTMVPTSGEEFDALYEAGERLQLDWWSWYQDYPDPQDWLSVYWTCDAVFNVDRVGYCNPDFDALVAQADRELDPAKRLELYEEAGQMLVDDVPAIFTFNDTNPRLVKPSVIGFALGPRDPWPGFTTPLTVDLDLDAAPIAASTPGS